MVEPEDYILFWVGGWVGGSGGGDGDRGVGVVGEDCEGAGCVETDAFDGRRGDGGGGQDAAHAGGDGLPDVGCGLFVVGAVVAVAGLPELDVLGCEGFDLAC